MVRSERPSNSYRKKMLKSDFSLRQSREEESSRMIDEKGRDRKGKGMSIGLEEEEWKKMKG